MSGAVADARVLRLWRLGMPASAIDRALGAPEGYAKAQVVLWWASGAPAYAGGRGRDG